MLNFLRTYQKYFLIVVTAAIVVSFCFFGTYGAIAQQSSPVDREIGKGVCGKPLMHLEMAALTRLISSSPLDRASWEKGGMPNLLNDGVIEKDFFSTGLGVILVKGYMEELKADFDQRIKKIHHYRPYTHPRSSQVSLEGIWSRFSPELFEHFKLLRSSKELQGIETFALMSRLYMDQTTLSPDIAKQILGMQQNQMGLTPDPLLANSDLSLFGFKSMEDWFGPKFVPLVAQFILNAAQIAEEKGYRVSSEEVTADLFQNIIQGYQQISKETRLTSEEVGRYFQGKARSLGLSDSELIHSWKKVILFRRLFEDISSSVLLDPLAYQQFDAYAKESTRISLYQLPPSLQLSDFRSLMKFQLYLEGVALDPSKVRGDLRMPRQLATLEQIEKRCPELIEQQFELGWSSVSKEELSRAISVKQTWDWETSNWELLKKNFPELQAIQEQPLAALNGLDENTRLKIDQFARGKMIDEQPDKIQFQLENAPETTSTIGLKMKGGSLPLPGIQPDTAFVKLLQTASLMGQTPNHASQRLHNFTSDGEHFYRIQVVKREDGKRIASFADATQDGTLDKLLDKKLEEVYPDVRKKDSRYFQMNNGQWKPFKEVKDQIGKYYFADLLKKIEDTYRNYYGLIPGKEGDLPLHFYSGARLLTHMMEAKTTLELNPSDPLWLGQGEDLTSQWHLEKSEQVMERSTHLNFSKEEMFALSPDEWSKVKIGEKGGLVFYSVLEKGTTTAPSLHGVEKGHEILSSDAKRDLMQHVMQRIHQKKAIDLSAVIAEGTHE